MYVCSVSKSMQLDVVELLKQVLQWTPIHKALIQAAKVGSSGCVKVHECTCTCMYIMHVDYM